MKGLIYYIHDPMCSWCWGFAPTLDRLEASLSPTVTLKRVLGGLAPDSQVDMPLEMQLGLQQTWRQIQSYIPNTQFNFDFWTQNTPRRSTWPACRAVIAARMQDAKLEKPMIAAIQQAYYLEAQNPSNDTVLIELAIRVGCDEKQFTQQLNSQECIDLLREEMVFSQQLGVSGFPSLILSSPNNQYYRIPVDYHNVLNMEQQITSKLAELA